MTTAKIPTGVLVSSYSNGTSPTEEEKGFASRDADYAGQEVVEELNEAYPELNITLVSSSFVGFIQEGLPSMEARFEVVVEGLCQQRADNYFA